MTEPGYQCQLCRHTFTEYQGCGSPRIDEPKCPTCGSHNVTRIDLPEEWGYTPWGSTCFG